MNSFAEGTQKLSELISWQEEVAEITKLFFHEDYHFLSCFEISLLFSVDLISKQHKTIFLLLEKSSTQSFFDFFNVMFPSLKDDVDNLKDDADNILEILFQYTQQEMFKKVLTFGFPNKFKYYQVDEISKNRFENELIDNDFYLIEQPYFILKKPQSINSLDQIPVILDPFGETMKNDFGFFGLQSISLKYDNSFHNIFIRGDLITDYSSGKINEFPPEKFNKKLNQMESIEVYMLLYIFLMKDHCKSYQYIRPK